MNAAIRWELSSPGRWRGFEGDSGSRIASVSRGGLDWWSATAGLSLVPGVFPNALTAQYAVHWFLRDQAGWLQARDWWRRQVEAAYRGYGPRLTFGQLCQAWRYGVETQGAELL